MSYWMGEAIAHTIISFGFDNGERLASSIETRKESDESYSSIAGFFKQYELAIVAADGSLPVSMTRQHRPTPIPTSQRGFERAFQCLTEVAGIRNSNKRRSRRRARHLDCRRRTVQFRHPGRARHLEL